MAARAPQGLFLPPRTATIVVAPYDASAIAKAQADYICDGVADEAQINAAITAAAGGHVYLHKGTFLTADEILANQSYTILEGSGFLTIIRPQVGMTNSINITGHFQTFANFQVDGNSQATRWFNNGTYNTFSHVMSTNHTSKNLTVAGGAAHITNNCYFIGRPVEVTGSAVVFDGECYFNGQGSFSLLEIESQAVSVIGCDFESYLGDAIRIAITNSVWVVTIMGNYFESTEICTNTIMTGAHLAGGSIINNYQGTAVQTTNFLSLNLGQHVEVSGNYSTLPIVVATAVDGCRVKNLGGISYNTLTGLSYLEKHYNEGTILNDTAAPAGGTWAVGDRIWNTAPAAGGAPGWVCTTAGTPGTWKAMASLGA